jgi:hypothetical protein
MFKPLLALLFAVVTLSTLSPAVVRAEEVTCDGSITKIEGEKVTVKTMSDEQQIVVEPATKIVVNGKPGNVTDLKVGQAVKCLADKRDGKIMCTSIEVMRDQN